MLGFYGCYNKIVIGHVRKSNKGEIKMKNYFNKIIIMFVMALGIIGFNYTIAFAEETNQSIKINNTTLNFNRIIYVDGVNGNDLVADGSEINPYKSIPKAQEVAEDGNAIYIKKGTYDLSSTGNGLWEGKHKISFIGEPNGTVIISDGTKNSARDNHVAAFETDCKVYNIIFKYTVGGRSTNYSSAFVGNGKMVYKQYGSFYNCVFVSSDKAPAPCYSNGDINVKFNNCSFIIPDNFQATYCYYGTDYTEFTNCAVSKDIYKGSKTSLGSVKFLNDDYSINSEGWSNIGTGSNPDGTQANIGVYGGEFAWGNWDLDKETIKLDKSTLSLPVGDSKDLIATTTSVEAQVNWSSSDESIATVDVNGKVTGIKEGKCIITAAISGTDLKSNCAVTVTNKETTVEPNEPTDSEYIINTANAKGDNTNNASGSVSIKFNGTAETTLSVVKTADVKEVWVGDTFTYTIVVTNTGSKTAKAVVINDIAPNHIDFIVDRVITTKGKVDESSTSKNIVINVGDIEPSETVTIKIPVNVVA